VSRSARVITALDFSSAAAALALAHKLDPAHTHVKVGNELFTATGPALIEQLQSLGFRVFLDLKFHDIPNTVAGAVRSATGLGVWMTNVHALGGQRMMEAAREAVSENSNTLLIGVTVLTSMTHADLTEIGFNKTVENQALALAKLSQASGLDGVVCSPIEARKLREACGKKFVLVTPGVRPPEANHCDQRRVMTPQDAVAAGSDYLVIGRPITQADNPHKACEAIVADLIV